MKYSKKCLIFSVFTLLMFSLFIKDGMCIDIILYNGKVVTGDKDFSIAEAIAVKEDKIEKVGLSSDILPLAHSHTRKIDLHGKMVLPGLIDAHLHPIKASTSELFEKIPDVQTLQELLDYIESQTRVKEQGAWIIHPKFFQTRIIEMRQPTKEELDKIAPNHPVFLNGSYAGMINSCALNLCGINKDTEHPGVLKDSETGEPTGIIRASAFPLIKKYMPTHEISYEQELDALEKMLKRYNRVGFTSITDGAQHPAGIRKYLDLWSSERLSVRVCVNIRAPHYESRDQFTAELKQLGYYSRFGNEKIRIGPLKVNIDGGILTGTAYLRQPWGLKAKEIYGIEDPEYRGILNMKREQLFDIVSIANELGWKMTAHVTGGGGVDMLLDAYENANKTKPIKNKRFSIIHGNFYTKEAMERCSKLGVIADFQPAWFYKDADAMKYILGEERIETFLPLRSMLEAGMIVNAGSDHMVKFDSYRSINPYNPFQSMWTMITRKTERGSVICPSEAISRKQALKMYTINNAYGTFEEDVKGSIEAGKLADLTVISADYLSCPVDSIRTIQVELTMVGGKIVYSKDSTLNEAEF